jgi:hypothetical protein
VDVGFDHGGVTVQLFIAVLAGAGRNIVKGTVLATFQMIGIVSLQLLYALFCLMLFPSNDKADSAMVTRQAQSLPSFASLLHLSAPSFACAPFRSTTRCLLSCAITLAV